jgi:prepilin-type N-terminal cleavage/methylation domain-containing protein
MRHRRETGLQLRRSHDDGVRHRDHLCGRHADVHLLGGRRGFCGTESGFTLAELVAVMFVIALISAVSVPMFMSYAQAARLKGGAQELATFINQARQVAIARNTSTCVMQNGKHIKFALGSCTGTQIWTGPGTDANGWFKFTDAVQVIAGPNVTFSHLGTATATGSYTVRDPRNTSKTMSVNVARSGRVTIGP